MMVDAETDAVLIDALWAQTHFPRLCLLCGYIMDSADDCMWWHGWGNCVAVPEEIWQELDNVHG